MCVRLVSFACHALINSLHYDDVVQLQPRNGGHLIRKITLAQESR